MFLSPNSSLVKGREELRKGKEISKLHYIENICVFFPRNLMATVLRTGFQYTVLAAFPRGKAGPKEGTAASCFQSEVFK